jgi:hypothetical protein
VLEQESPRALPGEAAIVVAMNGEHQHLTLAMYMLAITLVVIVIAKVLS